MAIEFGKRVLQAAGNFLASLEPATDWDDLPRSDTRRRNVRLCVRSAFELYAREWPGHSILTWNWPFDRLTSGEPFDGHEPWSVLLHEAVTQILGDKCIRIEWRASDVQAERPDLTEAQCMEVLNSVKNKHDANHGVTWDIIRGHADMLFGQQSDDTPEPDIDDTPRVHCQRCGRDLDAWETGCDCDDA